MKSGTVPSIPGPLRAMLLVSSDSLVKLLLTELQMAESLASATGFSFNGNINGKLKSCAYSLKTVGQVMQGRIQDFVREGADQWCNWEFCQRVAVLL